MNKHSSNNGSQSRVTNKFLTNPVLTHPTDLEKEPNSFERSAVGHTLKSALERGKTSDPCDVEITPKTAQVKEKPASALNPLIAAISPIQPGLIIVNVSNELCLSHVLFSFIKLATKKSSELGLPMPDAESVRSMHSGNRRNLEEAQLFAAANPLGKNRVPHATKMCPSQHKLDWITNEGQHILLPNIESAKGCCVVIDQVIDGPITPAVSQGLIRIGNAAQNAGVWVFLIVFCSGGLQKSQLGDLCDEYIEVHLCEPDVGVDIAFSIDCVGIRNLNSLGVGKTMCSVKLIDGVFRRRYEQYISGEHETRIMWVLRGQGKTLEEIGSLLKVNKSTVLRRLQGLSPPRHLEMAKDWLSRNLG